MPLHGFHTKEAAKFVVVDLNCLPEKLSIKGKVTYALTEPIQASLPFIEVQLACNIDESIEKNMLTLL